jgi:hypothetical protein
MKEQEIENIKNKNIIDMAITFTAMMRVFQKGSKSKITSKIEEIFSKFDRITEGKQYQDIHDSFCGWFTEHIFTAEKTFKNKRGTKPSKNTSYGQAAKIFDIVVKVYVYYCRLPSPEVAERLLPFLNGAVDTPIMKHLKSKFKEPPISATTIEEVDKKTYKMLQSFITIDIRENRNNIHPVQYDDIKWYELNRAQQKYPADAE